MTTSSTTVVAPRYVTPESNLPLVFKMDSKLQTKLFLGSLADHTIQSHNREPAVVDLRALYAE